MGTDAAVWRSPTRAPGCRSTCARKRSIRSSRPSIAARVSACRSPSASSMRMVERSASIPQAPAAPSSPCCCQHRGRRRRQSGDSSGTRRALASGMRETYEDEQKYSWILYAVCTLIVGGLGGYMLAVAGTRPGAGVPVQTAAAAPPPAPAAPLVDEAALQAYRDILARDPKNLQSAVKAGNLLYDARRYDEAIPFYQHAFLLNESDVTVRTDLGTALWYADRPDDALAQYERSLKTSPTHAQTLFNVGIVRADGKHDYAGAITAWEKLLATTPDYPNAAGVRELMADARLKSNVV